MLQIVWLLLMFVKSGSVAVYVVDYLMLVTVKVLTLLSTTCKCTFFILLQNYYSR